MVKDSKNKMWVTYPFSNRVVRLTAGGEVDLTITPSTVGSAPTGIALGSDDNIWFTMRSVDKIGKISVSATSSTDLVEYPVTGGGGPYQITLGSDNNLWFTLSGNDSIGTISSAGITQSFTSTALTGGVPYGIVSGPSDYLYFTLFNSGKIGRIKVDGTFLDPLPLNSGSTNCGPLDIIVGTDNNLWFTENSCNKIGKMTSGGTHTEYAVPQLTASLSDVRKISQGPLGTPMWFTLTTDNRIGMIAPSGNILGYLDSSNGITANSQPFDVTIGPDSTMWFTEFATDLVAKFTPSNVLKISTDATLPNAARKTPYSTTLQGTGGTAPYTFDEGSSRLPAGLTLASDGTISGTPTTEDTTTFAVAITDSEQVINLKVFTMTVDPPNLPDVSVALKRVRSSRGKLSAIGTPINVGLQPSGSFGLSFYLSRNARYDSTDKEIESTTIESLAPGRKSKSRGFTYTDSLARYKYLIACVDNDAMVIEQDDDNNCDIKKIPHR